jgi:hypothetical protein
MSYFDFTDDIIGIDQTNGITPTGMQPLLPAATTTTSTSTVVNQQQSKDLSDWRNIQLGTTSTLFDPLWLPQTPITPLSNPWTTSNHHTVYPSPYNQLSSSSHQHPYQWTNPNNNPPWKIPTFPIGPTQSFVNFNHPDTMNNMTDLATNTIVNPSTPIRFDKIMK